MAHPGDRPQDEGRASGPDTASHPRSANDIQPGWPGDDVPGGGAAGGTDAPAPAPGHDPSGPGHKEPPTGSNEGP